MEETSIWFSWWSKEGLPSLMKGHHLWKSRTKGRRWNKFCPLSIQSNPSLPPDPDIRAPGSLALQIQGRVPPASLEFSLWLTLNCTTGLSASNLQTYRAWDLVCMTAGSKFLNKSLQISMCSLPVLFLWKLLTNTNINQSVLVDFRILHPRIKESHDL